MLLAAMTIANAFRRSSALVAPRAGRLASGGRGKPKSGASTAPVAESASAYAIPSMEDVVSLCRKRGFVFGSSEIYNGFNGFYDYGPLGAELKRNIKDRWWRDMVRGRDDVCGLDSSIIGNPKIWEASGHVAGFSDPMVDDRETKKRYRADQLFYGDVDVDGAVVGCVTVQESGDMDADALKQAKKKWKKGATVGPLTSVADAPADALARIPPPGDASRPGDLTPPRDFNLMFSTAVGAAADGAQTAYPSGVDDETRPKTGDFEGDVGPRLPEIFERREAHSGLKGIEPGDRPRPERETGRVKNSGEGKEINK